jgi:two-component system, OmpR family, sensor kinase
MRLLPRSLAQRVAWATCATIAGSAACVALVSGFLALRFAGQREAQQVTDAVAVLAFELTEPGVDPVFIASDEARELKPTGMRVAVYQGPRLFAGDATLPVPAHGECTSTPAWTACGLARGPFLGVVARDTKLLQTERRSILLSSLIAVAVTSLLGALLARRIAAMLVAPLSRLKLAIEQVPANAPETAEIGADDGVTEVDALRHTLRAAFARLGDALATSRRFAADAAHELRTPLTVIIGELELNSQRLEAEAKQSNERARNTAIRLATLVNRLLVLATPAAKLDVGEELELQSAVDEALDLVPVAAWPRVTVTSEVEAYVRGDRALLAAMFVNAIENALKFSDGVVGVRLLASAEQVTVEVTDDGVSIPEAERARVFEPFFRTRATRASGVRGHGIGLSLIAHVTTVHGGTARFAARDRGTCLVIELPRAR